MAGSFYFGSSFFYGEKEGKKNGYLSLAFLNHILIIVLNPLGFPGSENKNAGVQ